MIGIIALAAALLTVNYRQGQTAEKRHEQLTQQVNQRIDQLGQQVNQLAQQVNQLAQQVAQVTREQAHLAGLMEGLRGRPLPEGD